MIILRSPYVSQTIETAKEVLEKNFPDYEEALREPSVIKGTAVSGDNFWKGESGHNKAIYIADHYGCPDPYAVTDMEENSETLDIFEPAMHNLYDVSSVVIDAIVAGEF